MRKPGMLADLGILWHPKEEARSLPVLRAVWTQRLLKPDFEKLCRLAS